MTKAIDVLIIGGGAAGLSAGIYCGRARLDSLVLERFTVGGQIVKADIVENYPAFPEPISGYDLIERMKAQAEKFGVGFASGDVTAIEKRGGIFHARTASGAEYTAKAVIAASGANPKRLGVPGEEALTGKGVSYCATCDGPLFRNKDAVVVGGGDSAVGEAVYLTRFVKRLVLVHRRDQLRAAKILQDRLLAGQNVELKLSCVVTAITGTNKVTSVRLKDLKANREEAISTNGIFIYVGLEPNSGFLKGAIELDANGFVITDERMETAVKGLFACGDVRKNTLKQVVTAASEGAVAAYSTIHYIEGLC